MRAQLRASSEGFTVAQSFDAAFGLRNNFLRQDENIAASQFASFAAQRGRNQVSQIVARLHLRQRTKPDDLDLGSEPRAGASAPRSSRRTDAGDANSGSLNFVAAIHADQKRGKRFDDARILELPAIHIAAAGNRLDPRPQPRAHFGIIAANDHVAIHSFRKFLHRVRGNILKRSHHVHGIRQSPRRLLRRRAGPKPERARRRPANRRFKRHGANHDRLPRAKFFLHEASVSACATNGTAITTIHA